jgi:hypothetical protein
VLTVEGGENKNPRRRRATSIGGIPPSAPAKPTAKTKCGESNAGEKSVTLEPDKGGGGLVFIADIGSGCGEGGQESTGTTAGISSTATTESTGVATAADVASRLASHKPNSEPAAVSLLDSLSTAVVSRPKLPFHFHIGTTKERARFQIQDPINFEMDSFYRKRDRDSLDPGVSLLVGRHIKTHEEEAVAIFFDRTKFLTEVDAKEWWSKHSIRFKVTLTADQAKPADIDQY